MHVNPFWLCTSFFCRNIWKQTRKWRNSIWKRQQKNAIISVVFTCCFHLVSWLLFWGVNVAQMITVNGIIFCLLVWHSNVIRYSESFIYCLSTQRAHISLSVGLLLLFVFRVAGFGAGTVAVWPKCTFTFTAHFLGDLKKTRYTHKLAERWREKWMLRASWSSSRKTPSLHVAELLLLLLFFFDIIDNFRYISCSASRLHNNLRYFIGICKWLAGVSLCGCGYFFLLSSLELHHLGSISFVSLMIWRLHHKHSNRIQIKIYGYATLRRGLTSIGRKSRTTYYFHRNASIGRRDEHTANVKNENNSH